MKNHQRDLYILQLQAELKKKTNRIIELCQQNVHLALENGALKLELQKLKGEKQKCQQEKLNSSL